MTVWRDDPGTCPICDAAHCNCTSMPAGGDRSVVVDTRPVPASTVTVRSDGTMAAEASPPATFSTATYQRPPRGRR